MSFLNKDIRKRVKYRGLEVDVIFYPVKNEQGEWRTIPNTYTDHNQYWHSYEH